MSIYRLCRLIHIYRYVYIYIYLYIHVHTYTKPTLLCVCVRGPTAQGDVVRAFSELLSSRLNRTPCVQGGERKAVGAVSLESGVCWNIQTFKHSVNVGRYLVAAHLNVLSRGLHAVPSEASLQFSYDYRHTAISRISGRWTLH